MDVPVRAAVKVLLIECTKRAAVREECDQIAKAVDDYQPLKVYYFTIYELISVLGRYRCTTDAAASSYFNLHFTKPDMSTPS